MVEGIDIDKFLQNGYWPNSRVKSPNSKFYDANKPSSPGRSSRIDLATPRRLPFHVIRPLHRPPAPSVEDETESLAKEHGSVVSSVPTEEPSQRGDPDQNPVLLPVHEYNPERRFVLVSNPSDASDESSGAEKENTTRKRIKIQERQPQPESAPYEANTGRKIREEESDKKRGSRHLNKRHSKLDGLPAIITDVGSEPKTRDGRRGKSTSKADSHEEDYFSPRLSSRSQNESSLSPDVIKHATYGRDRPYYSGESSPNAPGRNRSTQPPSQYSRTRDSRESERRYKEGSLKSPHSSSPTFQKRHTADFPKPTRRLSKEENDVLSARSNKRTHTSPYIQHDRESSSQYSLKSRDQRGSRTNDDALSSSDGELQRLRVDPLRRSKSGLPGERADLLGAPKDSRKADRYKSRGAPPLPSLSRTSSHEKGSGSSSSPRSATSPKETRNQREEARERPLSRASTARSILSAAAPIAIPAVVAAVNLASGGTASPIDPRRSMVPPLHARSSFKLESRPSGGTTPSMSMPSISTWRPPKFQPSRHSSFDSDSPITTYRRFSHEVKAGELPTISRCPRMREQPGHIDWLTLPRCDNFNICPFCYQTNFANTEFAHHFVPAPFRPRDRPLACDFGTSQYYHIAWLFTRKYKKPDLALFHGIANVSARHQPCTGNREARRIWCSVKDPRSLRAVAGFTVCHCCAKTIETLLPNLTGLFVPMDSPAEPTPGICAMHQQDERRRFVLYFDAMETAADRALATKSAPDVQGLADHIRELALVPECAKDRALRNQKWYTMRSIPSFTVCEECFEEVVMPRLTDRSADLSVAADFLHWPQRLPLAACQLYSDRMRAILIKAVRRKDLQYLERCVRERLAKEQEYHAKIAALDPRMLGAGGLRGVQMQQQQQQWIEGEIDRAVEEWKRWE